MVDLSDGRGAFIRLATAYCLGSILMLAGCGHGASAVPSPGMPSGDVAPPPPIGPVSPDIEDTTRGFHAIQIFDQSHKNIITIPQALNDGVRYGAVWGSRQATVIAWQTKNPGNHPLLYTPFNTDAPGPTGHNTGWWQKNHPDWILYECDKSTIAYVSGLTEMPLDFSNPAVAAYQSSTLGAYAEINGYSGISADVVDLTNITGHASFGRGGCGVWTRNHTVWVQKFSGYSKDPLWESAVLGWAGTLGRALHRFPRRLALAINTSPASYAAPIKGVGGDPIVRGLFDNVDVVLDEAGFAIWGFYIGGQHFLNLVEWIEYVQSRGKAFFIADDWNQQSGQPTVSEVDYSLATYMMGKEQASALYVGQNRMYGKENFYSQYSAAIGQACAPMFDDPADVHSITKNVYLRKYSGALAVVNVSSAKSYNVTLPKAWYTNIEGGKVHSPLLVGPNSGFVLLTKGGCN